MAETSLTIRFPWGSLVVPARRVGALFVHRTSTDDGWSVSHRTGLALVLDLPTRAAAIMVARTLDQAGDFSRPAAALAKEVRLRRVRDRLMEKYGGRQSMSGPADAEEVRAFDAEAGVGEPRGG